MFGVFGSDKNKKLGQWGEDYIAGLYKSKGYKIFDKNYFNRSGRRVGEIDLIALKGKQLVFVEVKTRTSDAFGAPAEAVDVFKQQKLLKACKFFIYNNPRFADYAQRIDVAEVVADLDKQAKSVNIIENAIEDTR